jgi:hypothetical protein
MKSLSINGIKKPSLLNENNSLHHLLVDLRQTYVSETNVITLIRIDGKDLDERGENEFAEVPLSAFDAIEVFTMHPREIAEETLKHLLEFTYHLEKFSQNAAEAVYQYQLNNKDDKKTKTFPEITALVDGVSTFIDSLFHVKRILRIGLNEEDIARFNSNPTQSITGLLVLLETDLLEILKETLEFLQKKELLNVAEMLREHLSANIIEWREKGIPAIIRSRDT